MKFILNISIYLYFLKVIKTLHPMISMWSVFYTYTDTTPSTSNLLRQREELSKLVMLEKLAVVTSCILLGQTQQDWIRFSIPVTRDFTS